MVAENGLDVAKFAGGAANLEFFLSFAADGDAELSHSRDIRDGAGPQG